MNPEVLTAKKWYRWLWLSPLLTIPSVVFLLLVFHNPGILLICGRNRLNCDFDLAFLVTGLIAILGSALWHLLLLVPALNKQSEFVRWHGRQALLLAGIRTAVPVAFLIYVFGGGYDELNFLWSILVLIAVWFFGTLWGQGQAARGDSSLMRWTGHGAGLPLPTGTAESTAMPELKAKVTEELNRIGKADENLTTDVLVGIFRFSRDPEQRRMALAILESRGLVEEM